MLNVETRLKQIMRERGLKQAWVAQQAGISPAQLSLLANGKGEPTLRTARAISRVLGVSIEELWPAEDNKEE
jgi:putative transcriptional regulator